MGRLSDAETRTPRDPDESVAVLLTRDEAEDLCWAYCGHKPAQRSDHMRSAIWAFMLAARWPARDIEDHKPGEETIVVRVARKDAEAMGYAGDKDGVDRVLEAIEEAL